MKNIHVLPTDKPSRLHFTKFEEELIFTPKYEKLNGINIYITSDEGIKDGDFIYSLGSDEIIFVEKGEASSLNKIVCKKIILTTDQDLIKNGVQAIDDDFLEWFVNNPSCDEVDVDCKYDVNLKPILDSFGNKVLRIKIPTKSENLSQIIIPKGGSKQETLEEYDAKSYLAGIKSDLAQDYWYKKFQQEQGKSKFSEEDMKKSFNAGEENINTCYTYMPFEEWVKQFKNK
jgi:hypothetical protein